MKLDALSRFHFLTNVQPPHRLSMRHLELVQFAIQQGGNPLLLAGLDLMAPGLGDCAQQQLDDPEASADVDSVRVAPQSVDPTTHTAGAGVSSEAWPTLAAGEFWARTSVAGTLWTKPADNIAPCSVKLRAADSGNPWVCTLGQVPPADYAPSVHAVPGRVTGVPSEVRRIRAYAPFPHYAFAFALGLHEKPLHSYRATCTLLDIVPAVVGVTIQRLKHEIRVRRADDAIWSNPAYRPVIAMPGFTAYPGGHAAIVHALAAFLPSITGAHAGKLQLLASKLAQDRECAGLHCSIDTDRGKKLGDTMGGWFVDAADGSYPALLPWAILCELARQEWR